MAIINRLFVMKKINLDSSCKYLNEHLNLFLMSLNLCNYSDFFSVNTIIIIIYNGMTYKMIMFFKLLDFTQTP